MSKVIFSAMLVGLAALLAAPAVDAADGASSAAAISADQLAAADKDALFRFDPFLNKMVAVAPADVKPGFLYNRYNPPLGRRVWGLGVEGGGFQYSMAPGSTQPAAALDLRATPQQLREELIARAPELAKMVEVRGAIVHMRLQSDETWELVRMTTITNVFDLETSRRWEWHGRRRVAVLHTGGYEWQFVDGKALPVTYEILSYASCR